ncbi:hypothetical protein [Kitasatospora cineracea]|uniref:hypothetical protein n=1 Tax=Kitasatospora cineracea TaxID=88074 RepID=UPI0037F555C2
MRIRQLTAAAALLTVALAVTGCDPEDASGSGPSTAAATGTPGGSAATGAASPSGTASKPAAGSSKTAAAPAGGQTVSAADETAFEKSSIDVNGCAAFYKTHKVMVVENAAPGQLKATQAKVTCDKYGRQLDLGGGVSSYYKFAAGASVTMFTKGLNPSGTYPRYEARKTTFDDYAKLHQPCFDTSKPDDHPADLCGNLFIYETDAGGLITSMHETWEIVD